MESLVFTEKLVPEVYLESRDYKVFLRLLDMLYSDVKYDLDNWIQLYNPRVVSYTFLPLLADFVGYNYNRKISISESRVIIDNFVDILKNRGSKIGIKQMLTVIINSKFAANPEIEEYKDAVSHLSLLEVYFDYDNGRIKIYFPKNLPYIRELMEYVRPIGTYIDLIETDFPEPESDIEISTNFDYNKNANYIPKVEFDSEGEVIAEDESYMVGKAKVNLSQIASSDQS